MTEVEKLRKAASAMGPRRIVARADILFQEGRPDTWQLRFAGNAGKVDSVTAFFLGCQPATILSLLDENAKFRKALEQIVAFDVKPQLHAQIPNECSICVAKEALAAPVPQTNASGGSK